MNLSNLRPKQKRKTTKRLGRGPGSGWGKTAGRGHKGAGQRSGKKLPYLGFRGGNLPLARKIPKRGFTSHQKINYQIVNLGSIQDKIKKESEINPTILKQLNLIKNENNLVKILADIKGPFSCKLVVKADKFSAKAKELIEKAGGIAECLSR
ncbi:MAG: 50S ribosomal protein L15 [Candidatus Omnitrophica bacterium]|jgi:large subunit ribosomal protein L15|nr:50S ribosomal protein L15 [Candidatus Omnitrophota bacterium]